MKTAIKTYLIKKMENAFEDSYSFVNEIIKDYVNGKTQSMRMLDIGSGTGEVTKKYLKDVNNCDVYGLDVIEPIEFPKIKHTYCNLEGSKFSFDNNYFDIVIAGQTIEHLLNKDLMIEEAYRVLKSGGLFVCATENIASFDNIISLMLGQEPLSQNTGSKFNTTSIISPNYMQPMGPDGNKYLHKNVTSYFGLQRLCNVNGFKSVQIKSFGNIMKLLEYLFPIYNRVVVVYGQKS